MIIGILQVDSVRDEFRGEFENYPEMFQSLFLQADDALEFRSFDVKAGELPVETSECDGYVITGSKDSVYDELPWIEELTVFVQRLHAEKRKLVGICFGHQLIAHCLGGRTEPARQGWAVGVHRSEILKRMSWMTPDVDAVSLVSSHKDQVVQLPDDAQILCGNDFCPIGGFMMGDHILTFQGHPEFSKAYSRTLMSFRREILGELCYEMGVRSLDMPLTAQTIGEWIVNFIGDS